MGERGCLRVFYGNAGTKPQYILLRSIAHFLPVKPFVAAAHTALDKSHAHQTGDNDMGLLQEKPNCRPYPLPQRLALATIEDAN